MGWFYPIVTGKTLLDIPAIFHLCFWVFAGSGFAYTGWSLTKGFIVMLAVAIGWEVFERFAEKAWPHIWKHPESWLNAYGSDILMGFLGVTLAYWLVSKQ